VSRVGDHVKKYGGGYATLIGAITALIVAINGYLELMRKDELVYEALSSKVNYMAEELSELKGQNSVMLVFLQSRFGGDVLPTEEPELVAVPDKRPIETMSAPVVRSEREPPRKTRQKPKPRIKIKAFQKLPVDLDSLVREQKQLQSK
jgi:hypothetical protein